MLLFKASWVLGKKDARIITSLLVDKLEREGLGRGCLSKGTGDLEAWGQGPQSCQHHSHQPLPAATSQSQGLAGWQEGRGVGRAWPDSFLPTPRSSPFLSSCRPMSWKEETTQPGIAGSDKTIKRLPVNETTWLVPSLEAPGSQGLRAL